MSLPQAYDWRKRDIKRDNFATFDELDNACAEARLILKRKKATIDQVRRAADIFNMGVRTLRSWHSARCDTIRNMSHRLDR